ncbi:hypothetical protein PC110_g9773 [Phytophthora cactorum]|uniref:HTH CENPB-type domain-containing protein n=1 Tax=Phytophthora cactorum TaxID=29920 RepID=A0A329SB76_9STRA|nr:hypothetical protein PC110_g9773 [Phytophthora cactorum]
MANSYTTERKQDIVAQVQAGTAVVAVTAATGVHERTIRKWVGAAKEGRSLSASRPGSKTFFPEAAEHHLYDWIVGLQLVGHPVGRSVIIRKAQEVALLGCGTSMGEDWYRRFKERFPDLVGRSAQSLSLK